MLVSCVCVCHDKPEVTHEAIGSLLAQTWPHWEALVIDSGALYDAGYYGRFPWRSDPRIRLIRSHETAETRRTRAMAPWCFNECFRKGWVRGELVTYLCDDDLLYPGAFETFVSFCRRRPDARAAYASQDLAVIYPNGWRALVGERRATEPGGRSCGGRKMDCEVDYLQFCHRADVLRLFPDDEYWPESKDTEEHADGLFIERVGALVPIHPIDVKVSQNRRTARSTYIPLSPLTLMDCMANGIPLLPGRSDEASSAMAEDLPLVTISFPGSDRAALAAQTYPRLEILPCEGGESAVGHNRALDSARGEYFLPMPGDHLPCPDMVERLLARLRANPQLSAVTCYRLGSGSELKAPCGTGLFRSADLRAVGGYDGGPPWANFFKLVNAGRRVDVLPEHLFSCPPTPPGDLFRIADREMAAERVALWKALEGAQRRAEELAEENRELRARLGLLRHRLADHLDNFVSRVPLVRRGLKRLVRAVLRTAAKREPLPP
ncbi:MAG TPA: hypothetical protein VFW33_06420 [Gemmataceae bacterium]|nr:hypothetical protein [Gemmataceae bacterium]